MYAAFKSTLWRLQCTTLEIGAVRAHARNPGLTELRAAQEEFEMVDGVYPCDPGQARWGPEELGCEDA
eukprot:1574216-Rhodomonas_salina.1